MASGDEGATTRAESPEVVAIERDKYRQALLDGKTALRAIIDAADPSNPLIPGLRDVWRTLHHGYGFKQGQCPLCGRPAKFILILAFCGPVVAYWECPNCGEVHLPKDEQR